MAITKEDIIQAAETLDKNGVSVTMAAVRDHLGGGSFATISPVLRGWKENRKTSQAVVIDMPGELKTAMEKLGAEFWSTASRISGEKLAMVQAEAEAAITAAEGERDQALDEIASLEDALEAARHSEAATEKKNLSLTEELIRLQEQMAHSRAENEQLREELRKATSDKERHSDEASRLLGLNEQVMRERDNALSQIKTGTEDLMAAENNARHHMSRAADLQSANDELKAANDSQQVELLKLKTTASGLEARVDDRNIKIAQLEKEVGELRLVQKQAATTEASLAASQSRVRELSTEMGELKRENKALISQVGELTGELTATRANIADPESADDL